MNPQPRPSTFHRRARGNRREFEETERHNITRMDVLAAEFHGDTFSEQAFPLRRRNACRVPRACPWTHFPSRSPQRANAEESPLSSLCRTLLVYPWAFLVFAVARRRRLPSQTGRRRSRARHSSPRSTFLPRRMRQKSIGSMLLRVSLCSVSLRWPCHVRKLEHATYF